MTFFSRLFNGFLSGSIGLSVLYVFSIIVARGCLPLKSR